MKVGALGDRMKRYEAVTRHFLTRRTPVIVRIDGKAFSTFTRGLRKPFDADFMALMVSSAVDVMRNAQGCKVGYIQSDEASFLLTDWDTLETEPWFGNNLQKIVSVASSIMTSVFNLRMHNSEGSTKFSGCANFDARAFQLPRDEVSNYFLWRAKDWHRNSIMMYARSFFSHKECMGKKLDDLHEMLHEAGKNWATDLTLQEKNGTWLYRLYTEDSEDREIKIISDILPTFDSVDALISSY